jgi:RNA polymerase sigma factor (sigma-70 family)
MPETQDRQALEALLRDNLGLVDRIAASLCRRHGLAGDEADDFVSWTHSRLVEDDYATLRKFRGESALATYLTVVIGMLFREYRVREWGRWRPSAAARRLGRLAMRLETLIYRDKCTFAQAGQVLRSEGEDVSDRQLIELLAQIPPKRLPRPLSVGSETLEATPAPSTADERVAGDEADRERLRIEAALFRALDSLPSEDRLIVQMWVWEEMSVADVARALNLPQKPLYRRIERALKQLRSHLEAEGVTLDSVRRLLEGP